MLVVETIAKIRRAYFVQQKPIKEICRDLHVSRKVVRKVIRSDATEFRYERGTQRRLTEELKSKEQRHRLLLMLDEFPALGRLDFFESALAFMAGYGLKSFLIAQSLNQIEKAYGPNNAILDNCHVRVSFATNDERTAKRVSDALGTATEMRAMKNYAGHRLSPWFGHLMVSRQETARALLTPGEVMELPPADEIILVSGLPPIRAKKARYYEDRRLNGRILPPPQRQSVNDGKALNSADSSVRDDWSALPPPRRETASDEDPANGGIRREPELPEHADVAPIEPTPAPTIDTFAADEPDDEESIKARLLRSQGRALARQAALDPDDGIAL